METWRIEKMIPVKQEDPLCNGKLYQGDSYIFLSTTMKGSAMVWHIHFWLGEETSQVLRIGPPLSCTPFRSLIIYSFVYGLSLCDLNMMTPLLSSLDTMRRALHHTLKSLSSSNTYTQSERLPPPLSIPSLAIPSPPQRTNPGWRRTRRWSWTSPWVGGPCSTASARGTSRSSSCPTSRRSASSTCPVASTRASTRCVRSVNILCETG